MKQYTLFVSCPTSKGFRKKVIDPLYKSNRSGSSRPPQYDIIRQCLIEDFGAVLLDKLEADDIISICATNPLYENSKVVSTDKDFFSTPCTFVHVNWQRREWKEYKVLKHEADYNHLLQTLMGDAADGYKGIPRVGEKRAKYILDNNKLEHLWDSVVLAYRRAGLSEKDALRNARLAYLLRFEDYNIKNGKIKLWKPPCHI